MRPGDPLWFAEVSGFGVVEWEVLGVCSVLFQGGARMRMTPEFAGRCAEALRAAVASGQVVDGLAPPVGPKNGG